MAKVAIVGASGYTGGELLRLLAGHPELEVVVATGDTQAGQPIAGLYPSLVGAYGDRVFDTWSPDAVDGVDLAFCGLPHGASQAVVPTLRDRVGHIVDLAADFRLADASLYPEWYGEAHTVPELLADAVYGLPELFRSEVEGAALIAGPGCYPTAAALALAPLLRAGLVEPTGIVVDAVSGVSGAGRAPKPTTTFCTADGDVTAYGLLRHRHTPEIEQTLTRVGGAPAQVIFTPHLVPMSRGMLATCYARPVAGTSAADVAAAMGDAYAGERFVSVVPGSPSTKATQGSNAAHVSAVLDERTGWVLALCALDNLGKGASGAALQCANLALGLPEDLGLSTVGVYP
ncbi:MAG TPA: N-acetyl-gamma-glutamyl-phosphate reductase [Iamia sp.]|nr:N-acetyl-gamma-glutamyl-phosphate reductase [Iamia sp.]